MKTNVRCLQMRNSHAAGHRAQRKRVEPKKGPTLLSPWAGRRLQGKNLTRLQTLSVGS